MDWISLQDIYRARERIARLAQRAPLIVSPTLSKSVGAEVLLKLENLQPTGSFKIRGAANKITSLSDAERKAGVIAVSSGNHGRAVSYVCRREGIPATIVLSKAVPQNKRNAIRELGTEMVVYGDNADEAMLYADQLREEKHLTMVHPFDDPIIIAGQGTIGLEILEDYPQLDTIVVPLSGGGLMGGIALALKTANPAIRTVGVSMEKGAAMVKSLRAGKVADIDEQLTLADALAGALNRDNRYTFPLIQQTLDEAVLVSETQIAEAMAFCLKEFHLVVEGGGAVGVAALLSGKMQPHGKHVVVVISGANVEIATLLKVVQNENIR